MTHPAVPRARELTGRVVLVAMLAFFGLIIGVNVVMIRAATSTFGGVETGSSYQAGLVFKHELAAAQEQNDRGWQVSLRLSHAGEDTVFEARALDHDARPVTALEPQGKFIHPADARRDLVVAMTEVAPGLYRGVTPAAFGQWTVQFDLSRDGTRQFRSRTKIMLR
jgi:nitrogen fixation protein FixH